MGNHKYFSSGKWFLMKITSIIQLYVKNKAVEKKIANNEIY